jgi:hypothetical protein
MEGIPFWSQALTKDWPVGKQIRIATFASVLGRFKNCAWSSILHAVQKMLNQDSEHD